MKDKIKYVILIGMLIAAGLICIVLMFQIKKSSSELSQISAEISTDSSPLVEHEHGLYTQSFQDLRDICGQSWFRVLSELEQYCMDNNLNASDLYCTDNSIQVTEDNEILATVFCKDKKLIVLIDLTDDFTNVYIEEVK